jgi:hypothetical protein
MFAQAASRLGKTRFLPAFTLFSSQASSSTPSQAQLRAMSVKSRVDVRISELLWAVIFEPNGFDQSAIAEHKVMLFSKSYCPYCRRAKQLFAKDFPDTPVEVIELVTYIFDD